MALWSGGESRALPRVARVCAILCRCTAPAQVYRRGRRVRTVLSVVSNGWTSRLR